MLKHILLTRKSNKIRELITGAYDDFNHRVEKKIALLYKENAFSEYDIGIGNKVPIDTYFPDMGVFIKCIHSSKICTHMDKTIDKGISNHIGVGKVYMDDWIAGDISVSKLHSLYQNELIELIEELRQHTPGSSLYTHYVRNTRHIFQQSRYWNRCLIEYKELEWKRNIKPE